MQGVKRSSEVSSNPYSLTKVGGIAFSALLAQAVFVKAFPATLEIGDVGPKEFEAEVNRTVIEFGRDVVCSDLAEGIFIVDQTIVDHAECDKAEELIEAYSTMKKQKIDRVRERLLAGYKPLNPHARNIGALGGWIATNQRRLGCSHWSVIGKLEKRPDCHSRHKSSSR